MVWSHRRDVHARGIAADTPYAFRNAGAVASLPAVLERVVRPGDREIVCGDRDGKLHTGLKTEDASAVVGATGFMGGLVGAMRGWGGPYSAPFRLCHL